ncbi:hypothetical protein INS49_005882 [Diaporthe citri]|uniref:uncharacterized protein n=1 Tax=Diaporthe citri TaxID=83186 RepID=UPI001C808F55|nr:uncharacterized protein INS49_005882 [Diaporthe citri]KAG6364282.1 hypothetical protein INS49_005882 [Diaporthe citri]
MSFKKSTRLPARNGNSHSTGDGSVHSNADLVSRSYVKEGSQNAAAYELAKQNYHRYLSGFLVWYVYHRRNLYRVQEMTSRELAARGVWNFDADVYKLMMDAYAPLLWGPPGYLGPVLKSIMEKTLAELKCRLNKDHIPQDRFGQWQEKETHLAEHRPFLNNVTTSLKRAISNGTLDDMSNDLNVLFDSVEGNDMDENGDSEEYNNQTFIDEMGTYDEIMDYLGSDNIRGPTKPDGLPYEILEFVPQMPGTNFNSRIDRLRMDLITEETQCEIIAPKGDDSILGGRNLQEYLRNEQFIKETLEFIFELLALDPGLSRTRMLDIGKLFHSLLLEPWYFNHGHGDRQAGESAEENEQFNMELRGAVIDLDNVTFRMRLHENGFASKWWGENCFHVVIDNPNVVRPGTIDHVHSSAWNHWSRFYSNWLQILANVELSHSKLTQEQLDAEDNKSCPICMEDYVVGNPNSCAVWIECGNNHTLCKKCYTQLSLTPTRPYNELMTTRYCPQCRQELQYEEDMNDLTDGLNLMPSLNTDFPYHN